MLKQSRRTSVQGNALMEYAVPAALILFSAGVLATVTDATGVMAEYYLSASGHTKSSLDGTTFKTNGLAYNSYAANIGFGFEGFTNFASLQDGNGGSVSSGGRATFFADGYVRTGGRVSSPSPEYLYPSMP